MTVKSVSITHWPEYDFIFLFCRIVRITPVWKDALKSPVFHSVSDCTKYEASEQTEFSWVGFLLSVCKTREYFQAACLSVEAKLNGINCNLFYHLSHTHRHTRTPQPTKKKRKKQFRVRWDNCCLLMELSPQCSDLFHSGRFIDTL